MREILAGLALLAVLGGLTFLLIFLLRFAFYSGAKLKGQRNRLTKPQPVQVGTKWNIKIPDRLVRFFSSGETSLRTEFCLVRRQPLKRFYISEFIPITVRDIEGWLIISRVPGVPIALDGAKGTYYIPFSELRENGLAPVLYRKPGAEPDEEVAGSIEEFLLFDVQGS